MKIYDKKKSNKNILMVDIVGFQVPWNPITLDFLLMEKIAYDY